MSGLRFGRCIGAAGRALALLPFAAQVPVAAQALTAHGIQRDAGALLEQQYSLEQSVRGGKVRSQWNDDGSLIYSENNKREPCIWRIEPASFERRCIDSMRSLYEARQLPASAELVFFNGATAQAFNTATGATRRLRKAEVAAFKARQPQAVSRRYPQTPDIMISETANADHSAFARVSDGEILLRSPGSTGDRALTDNTPADYIWNPLSLRFSPAGNWLAVTGEDFAAVPQLPNVDWGAQNLSLQPFYYPPAGGTFPQAGLSLFATAGDERIDLDTGSDDHYLRIDRFNDSGSAVFYFKISRDARTLEYRRYDIGKRRDKRLFRERSKTAIAYPYAFVMSPNGAPIAHLPNKKQVLWLSERDGWRQLFQCSLEGRGCRKLSDAKQRIDSIVGVDAKGEAVFLLVQSDPARPYDTHLHRYSLSRGELQVLTHTPGRRQVSVDPSGRYFVETVSSATQPAKTWLRDTRRDRALLLSETQFDNGDLWTAPEPFVVKAADGKTDLHGLLYRPPQFSARASYALVEYIYAGPQAIWTSHEFLRGDRIPRALASAGFAVAVVDGRGTPGRSKAFQDYTYGRLGQVEIADHAAALQQLIAARPYLDPHRVGVFGTSFGGYFAIRAMLDAPELYRVGVASAPADIARSHIFSPVEAYMGLMADNPKGYEAARLEPLAGKLQGRLLIVSGTADVNTPFAHALGLMDAFIAAKRPVHMVAMPGRNHHFKRAGDSRRDSYWLQSALTYFADHLASGGKH